MDGVFPASVAGDSMAISRLAHRCGLVQVMAAQAGSRLRGLPRACVGFYGSAICVEWGQQPGSCSWARIGR